MAEPLKNSYGQDIPRTIASMVKRVHPDFNVKGFVQAAIEGYEELELLQRAWHIAHAMQRYLPAEFGEAARVLVASLGPKLGADNPFTGFSSFIYLPHACFVAKYGLDDFEASMKAQYEITQRFTCEYSIRPFLEQHTDRTLAQLRVWTRDKSEHVRRLVSEGTRPRLPWAPRLRVFDNNPTPILELLDALKDDPSLYVRRSVANHMNDIGKDNPQLLVATMQAWSQGASPERQWIIKHGLRSAIKRADAGALDLLGYGKRQNIKPTNLDYSPQRPRIGDTVTIEFDLENTSAKSQRLLVDMVVRFVKANGSTSPKVFKVKEVELLPGDTAHFRKRISLEQQTTRKHYPGDHEVDVVINGHAQPLCVFEIRN